MNKDNLNYIKEQIKHKEKQKKIKENEKSKEVDEEYSPTNYKNYHAEN